MLPKHFGIRNVDVWNADGVATRQDLLVHDGKIEAIGPSGSLKIPDDAFDGEGKVLLPAGLDLQTHLRVPGQSEKETPMTGLRAALRGGYAAVLTMPNTKPVIDSVAVCEQAAREVAEAERTTGVKVFLSAAMTMGQQGREVVDAKALEAWGVKALTDDGIGVARDDVMDRVFAAAAASGLPLLQHAEVPGHGGVLAPGPTQAKLGLKAYPARAEADMVARDIALAAKHKGARYHVLHVSARETLQLVRQARARGEKGITGEVTPHHLFFCSEDIPAGNTAFKMNPPIRGREDREALIEGLADGTLEFLSTDHAPHESARKGEDFSASAFGTTGLETALRVLLDLYLKKRLSPARLVQVWASKPAEFLKVSNDYGAIERGIPLRAVWLDAAAAARPVTLQELESKSKNNCFVGHALPGRILGVFNPAGLFRF